MLLEWLGQMESLHYTNFVLDKAHVNNYFDRYQYKVKFDIIGIHFFRSVKNEYQFSNRLDTKCSYYLGHGKNMTVRQVIGSSDNIARNIVLWTNKHKALKSDIKFMFCCDTFSVYYNSDDAIKELIDSFTENEYNDTMLPVTFFKVEKIAGFQRDVIYHMNPKRKIRTYFSSFRISDQDKTDLWNYVRDNVLDIDCSYALRRFFQHSSRSRFMNSTFFIDLDDERHITYLMLKFPELIRKVSNIEKRINTT
jgi:hypothetical protein